MKHTKNLTQMQHNFVINYIKNGFNAYQAAVQAGYSEHVANTQTQYLVSNPVIKDRIAKAYDKIDTKLMKELRITMEDKMKVLSRIIYDIVPEDDEPKRSLYKVAISAMTELNKMQGDYAPDKRLSVTVDATKERLAEVKRQYEEF